MGKKELHLALGLREFDLSLAPPCWAGGFFSGPQFLICGGRNCDFANNNNSTAATQQQWPSPPKQGTVLYCFQSSFTSILPLDSQFKCLLNSVGKIGKLHFTDWNIFSHSPHFQPRELPELVEATELELDFGAFCPHSVLDGCMGLPVPKRF